MQADSKSFVVKTLDRKTLWEMQTPQVLFVFSYADCKKLLAFYIFFITYSHISVCFLQQVIKPDLLKKGFELVNR